MGRQHPDLYLFRVESFGTNPDANRGYRPDSRYLQRRLKDCSRQKQDRAYPFQDTPLRGTQAGRKPWDPVHH